MNYLKTLRLEQWYKNLVVFVGIIFALQPHVWLSAVTTFIAFCLISSAGYIINDLHDTNEDRTHPIKRNRPIAAGYIGKGTAATMAITLSIIGLLALLLVNLNTFLVGLGYLALATAYTYYLKPRYYIGLTAKSLGFVLRALAGCTALVILPSGWLFSCVFILALLLATAKLRNEGVKELSITLLFIYTTYTFYQNPLMIITVVPVAYAIYRYIQLYNKGVESNPVILKDRRLLSTIFLWLVTVSLALHFGGIA